MKGWQAEPVFICPKCRAECASPENLSMHIWRRHGEGMTAQDRKRSPGMAMDYVPTMSYRTLVTGVILGFIVIATIALLLLVLR